MLSCKSLESYTHYAVAYTMLMRTGQRRKTNGPGCDVAFIGLRDSTTLASIALYGSRLSQKSAEGGAETSPSGASEVDAVVVMLKAQAAFFQDC